MKKLIIKRCNDGTYSITQGDRHKECADHYEMVKCVSFMTCVENEERDDAQDGLIEPHNGDFLIFTLDNGGRFYLIYKGIKESNDAIEFHFCVNGSTDAWHVGNTFYVLCPRNKVRKIEPMDDDDKRWFINGMHKLNYMWDSEHKEVVHCVNTPDFPNEDEECFYINDKHKIASKFFHYYDDEMRKRVLGGNCFSTKEDAEKALKSVNKV